jgi:hypothetical protein
VDGADGKREAALTREDEFMPTAPVPKRWTFMVYMAGDNNLDPNGVKDLREMKRVGSTPDVNIVAQFDRAKPHTAKRYFLTRGGTARSDAVADLGRIDTGQPRYLVSFVKWAVRHYPADRYILVLWNHGEGWDDTDLWPRSRGRRLHRVAAKSSHHGLFHAPVRRLLRSATIDPVSRAILIDEDAKDFLDNHEMKKVLAATVQIIGKKLDILGMDACLMSMAEVGYQCRTGAAYTVGSTETEPLEGWPYNTILRALARKPSKSPRQLSRLIVRKYLDSYRGDQVTQSACELASAEDLAAAVRGLATELRAGLGKPDLVRRIAQVREQVQYYDVDDNIDLADFCERLARIWPGAAVRGRCEQVLRVLARGYVVAAGVKGVELRGSRGVSIYFPRQPISPLYPGLDFSRRTGWDRFLKAYRRARSTA